ncbi:SDR family oxidoreductase [Agrobacterium tumefaciens]|uniref:SDR family oxidoreductase n=1 Tax=Agrobacterium tumefaciens TaxID=358 RepID=UPI002781BB90|nr:SDR family oxidoreductase [Agrobacterium tumefaciens]MDP9857480.1 NAD(P)H dehydrogenase (quinone) [Agrobacterium tumefaciens]
MGKILITGAGGNLGSLVIKHLLETEKVPAGDIVAASRTPEKLADLAAKGIEARKADFNDPATLRTAFAGIDKLLIVSTDALDGQGTRLKQHKAAVAAAKEAGVGRVFYTSLPRPDESVVLFAPDHLGTEKAILETGLPYTFFRNNWYQENILMAVPHALSVGQWFVATGDGGIPYIARDDAARAIAAGLAKKPAENKIYTLTGAELLTSAEVAAIVSEVTGKPLTVVQITEEQLIDGLKGAGFPGPVARTFASFDANQKKTLFEPVTGDFKELTGLDPAPFKEFVVSAKAALLA